VAIAVENAAADLSLFSELGLHFGELFPFFTVSARNFWMAPSINWRELAFAADDRGLSLNLLLQYQDFCYLGPMVHVTWSYLL